MASGRFTFHRTELALNLIANLKGDGIFDASSGMFLAAPRRTGKSTFLQEDLIPEMQKQDFVTVYVDLWSDQAKDPTELITTALNDSIMHLENPAQKLIQAVGLKNLNIASVFQLELGKARESSTSTLSDAFAYLSKKSNQPIALIIDEAQHALNTQTGINSMFAIKSARDLLKNKLFLVFTGSNRDKLAHLVLRKDQPFFGAQITSFPLLGKGFTDAYTDWINSRLVPENHFSKNDMFSAFELVGHRPEMLRNIIQDIALNYKEVPDLGLLLKNEALELRNHIWSDLENEYASLTQIQRAVLEVIISKGKDFSPFTEDSMNAYREILNRQDFGPPQIQAALEALRERNLVWNSARGSYALEDASLVQWFFQRKSSN